MMDGEVTSSLEYVTVAVLIGFIKKTEKEGEQKCL